MSKKTDLGALLSAVEKRRMAIEEKRTLFQFELAFFIPLFALLFIVTYFSQSDAVKLFFFILTIIFIIIDLVYSILLYRDVTEKQKRLEKVIHEKLGGWA